MTTAPADLTANWPRRPRRPLALSTERLPTVDELRRRRITKLAARAERACAAFDAADTSDALDTDERFARWFRAGCTREDALRALAFDDPAHPLLRAERDRDADALRPLIDAAEAIRTVTLMRKPTTLAEWTMCARTPGTTRSARPRCGGSRAS